MPDLNDALAVVGLGMLFAGCWWIYPPAALIVVGTIVAGTGFWGAR